MPCTRVETGKVLRSPNTEQDQLDIVTPVAPHPTQSFERSSRPFIKSPRSMKGDVTDTTVLAAGFWQNESVTVPRGWRAFLVLSGEHAVSVRTLDQRLSDLLSK